MNFTNNIQPVHCIFRDRFMARIAMDFCLMGPIPRILPDHRTVAALRQDTHPIWHTAQTYLYAIYRMYWMGIVPCR